MGKGMVDQQTSRDKDHYIDDIQEIDFQQYWLVLRRRWLPAAAVLGTTIVTAAYIALSQESYYQAAGKVLFRNDRASDLTGLDSNLGTVDSLTFQAEPLATQAEIVRSLPIMESVLEQVEIETEDGKPLSPIGLLKDVAVKPIPETEILQISYSSKNPEEAAQVVNAVIETYRVQNINDNRKEVAAAREFIEDQLPETEAEVSRTEERLRLFKEQNGLIVLEKESANTVLVLSDLDREKNQLTAKLAELDARLAELQSQLAMNEDDALNLTQLNQSEGIQSILAQVYRVEEELSAERARYRNDHPAITELERKKAQLETLLKQRTQEVSGNNQYVPPNQLEISDLQQSLITTSVTELRRLQVERSGLQNRLLQLESTLIDQRQRANTLPKLERIQRDLERQLQATQTTYETLLNQLQEIRVVENQTVGNVQIIALATVPEEPAGPKRSLYLVGGGLLGILLAAATAFAIDLADNSVKNIQDINEVFGYPLLGVIPLIKKSVYQQSTSLSETPFPKVLVHPDQNSNIRDTYHLLLENLKFVASDISFKTMLITSAVQGEGKSEIAVNLAMSFSQVGRKVLLIDADMRFPRQHYALNIPNKLGLSHVISGQVTAEHAIQAVRENLDVLTAGVVPPNPVAMLESKRAETLLNTLRQEYDLVIIDTSPIIEHADASLLANMADSMLIVARPNRLKKLPAKTAKQLVERSTAQVLGIVVNGVSVNSGTDQDFFYLNPASDRPNQPEPLLTR